MYKQIDGVSMGSPLGTLIPIVIMTELERVLVKDLFNKGYRSIIFDIWMIH